MYLKGGEFRAHTERNICFNIIKFIGFADKFLEYSLLFVSSRNMTLKILFVIELSSTIYK